MGDLICLNAADGTVRWSKKLGNEYKFEVPLWGYAAHLLDRRRFAVFAGRRSGQRDRRLQ